MADTPGEYIPDPAAETDWVIQGFLKVIEECAGAVHIEAIQEQQAVLEAAHQNWLVDEKAKYHLKTGAVMLAAYRVLYNQMPKTELLALLHEATRTQRLEDFYLKRTPVHIQPPARMPPRTNTASVTAEEGRLNLAIALMCKDAA